MTESVHDLLDDLYAQLEATAERPVDREASRWIGEAEAVAGDIAGSDVPIDVIEDRIGHVDRLLSEIDGVDDPAADEHVTEAKRLVDEIEGLLGD
jgi:hypothetical protein